MLLTRKICIWQQDREVMQRMCNAILPCIVCSIVTAAITTKILAAHYFKIVDGYVEDMTRMTKEFVDAMKSRKE